MVLKTTLTCHKLGKFCALSKIFTYIYSSWVSFPLSISLCLFPSFSLYLCPLSVSVSVSLSLSLSLSLAHFLFLFLFRSPPPPHFPSSFPCSIVCPEDDDPSLSTITFLSIMSKVRLEACMWVSLLQEIGGGVWGEGFLLYLHVHH